MRVAYLINQYPAISHSFIRREIKALEHLGFEIMRIALRGWDRELADDQDYVERERTNYVLRVGAAQLLLVAGRMLIKRPGRVMGALLSAWQMSRTSDRSLLIHLAYLVEACWIEEQLRKTGISHLHAHFGTNSADVAMLVHILGGQTWSFTAHGTESFDNPQLINLSRKVSSCTFVVTVSYYGRSQIYRSAELRDWEKVHVVRCGVDASFRDVSDREISPHRILCVARLSPEKGHFFLLEAIRVLKKEGLRFQVILAGDGELRSHLEAKINQYKLNDHVLITGWIDSARVRDEILGARALVVPSLGEGLPVVIMEAMALRRPVIATFVGGVPELVCPEETGWLVPAGDPAALAAAIRACLETPNEAIAKMGARAHARVLQSHDVNTEAEKLRELFHATAHQAQESSEGLRQSKVETEISHNLL